VRILFLTNGVPWPANHGSKQRTLALLKSLAKKHEVTLASPLPSSSQSNWQVEMRINLAGYLPLPPLPSRQVLPQPDGGKLRKAFGFVNDFLVHRTPYSFRNATAEATSALSSAVLEHDGVFCRYTWMMPLLEEIPWHRVVLDADDLNYVGQARQARLMTHGWSSLLLAAESARTFAYERSVFRKVAQTLVCSQRDCIRIGSGLATVVPNGVELPTRELAETPGRSDTIVWVGIAAYDLNIEGLRWFFSQVWPRLKKLVPKIRMQIVGLYADAQHLPFADSIEGVELVGPVDESAPWMAGGVASVVPLLNGTGTRIKIMESLACGRPVVSTPVGAEGYEDVDENHGLIRASRPEEMANRIAALLSDPDHARELGLAGRKLAEERFSWDVATATLADDTERWILAASYRYSMGKTVVTS
jgi:glycosyltransferase involved in cell wall biosynthesis